MVNDDRSLMRMHMSNSSKEGIAHAHAHPLFILHAVHMCSVKVIDQIHLKLLVKSLTAVRSESAGGLMVMALIQKSRDLGLSPSWCSPFPALNCSEKILFI